MKKAPAAQTSSPAPLVSGLASRSSGIAATQSKPSAMGSRVVEATSVEPRETSVAQQLLPGSRTVAADDPVVASPSPTIAAEARVSTYSENNVEHIREYFHLPRDITTWAMSSEDSSNHPPRFLVAFNKAIMKHGARPPLHPLVRDVLTHWGLSPSQLNSNAYKIMAGMHILWRLLFGVDLTAEEVCFLYKPSSSKSEVGYFFLAPWEKRKIMMTNLSSSCEGWKDKNFWVRGELRPL